MSNDPYNRSSIDEEMEYRYRCDTRAFRVCVVIGGALIILGIASMFGWIDDGTFQRSRAIQPPTHNAQKE